jgi:hypothetical protein
VLARFALPVLIGLIEPPGTAIDCALRALRCAVAMIQSVTGNAVTVK